MIKIQITRTSTQTWKAKENLVVKKTPTELTEESRYSNDKKNLYIEEYQVVETDRSKEITETILTQEITDETKFNIANVIKAINNL